MSLHALYFPRLTRSFVLQQEREKFQEQVKELLLKYDTDKSSKLDVSPPPPCRCDSRGSSKNCLYCFFRLRKYICRKKQNLVTVRCFFGCDASMAYHLQGASARRRRSSRCCLRRWTAARRSRRTSRTCPCTHQIYICTSVSHAYPAPVDLFASWCISSVCHRCVRGPAGVLLERTSRMSFKKSSPRAWWSCCNILPFS